MLHAPSCHSHEILFVPSLPSTWDGECPVHLRGRGAASEFQRALHTRVSSNLMPHVETHATLTQSIDNIATKEAGRPKHSHVVSTERRTSTATSFHQWRRLPLTEANNSQLLPWRHTFYQNGARDPKGPRCLHLLSTVRRLEHLSNEAQTVPGNQTVDDTQEVFGQPPFWFHINNLRLHQLPG